MINLLVVRTLTWILAGSVNLSRIFNRNLNMEFKVTTPRGSRIRKRSHTKVDNHSVIYNHCLQMYRLPPTNTISLEAFEELAVERLKGRLLLMLMYRQKDYYSIACLVESSMNIYSSILCILTFFRIAFLLCLFSLGYSIKG